MKKVVFVTGTRADYGKLKALIHSLVADDRFDVHVYVTGMHLSPLFGSTYQEVIKDFGSLAYVANENFPSDDMATSLGQLIINFSQYIAKESPDLIVVHGDRVDAFGAAIAGALNNVLVAHVEGGEVSGTIDDSLRHSTSKLCHIHFVANQAAHDRLIQLGENPSSIHIIGSPDIDVMLGDLPSLEEAIKRYSLPFNQYALLMYHPVTTEHELLAQHVDALCDAVLQTKLNYLVVYPNNDYGSEIILSAYNNKFRDNNRFYILPSIRFEYFLALLRNARFVIGNSSAGIREAPIYGIPSIDVGTRQKGRAGSEAHGIVHVSESREEILRAINSLPAESSPSFAFGGGNSASLFHEILTRKETWDVPLQKVFIDRDNL